MKKRVRINKFVDFRRKEWGIFSPAQLGPTYSYGTRSWRGFEPPIRTKYMPWK